MAMGMSVSEFWDGDPTLAIHYRKAFEVEQEIHNMWQWRMGAYFVSALDATVGNVFRKKGTKPKEYVDHPFPLSDKKDEDGLTSEQKRQNDKFTKALESSMMRHYQKKMAKESKDA